MKPSRLAWKIVSMILLVAIFFVLISGYHQINMTRELLIQSYVHEAKSITQALSLTSEMDDFIAMGRMSSRVQNFYDASDDILLINLESSETDLDISFEEVELNKTEVLLVTAPILYEDNIIGYAEIFFSKDRLINEISLQIKNIVISRLILVSVFFILAYIYIHRTLSTNLVKISEGIGKVHHGHFKHKIKIKTNDELEEIATTFNDMSKHIQRDHIDLSRKVTELELANNRVKRLLQVKSDFITKIAHDLSTPLTPIKASMGVMSRALKDKNYSSAIKIWKIMMKNIGYFSSIVGDTLSISRLDENSYNLYFSRSNLIKLIENTITANGFDDGKKNVIITIMKKDIPEVYVDTNMIKQVMWQIFNNASHFAIDKKNKLDISFEVRRGCIITKFQDYGQGVSKAKLKQIFNDFYKADESRHEHNSGLGLSIAKRIVEGHDGKIWAESSGLGKGLSIYIKLYDYNQMIKRKDQVKKRGKTKKK